MNSFGSRSSDLLCKGPGNDEVANGIRMDIGSQGRGCTHPSPTQRQENVHRKIDEWNYGEIIGLVGVRYVSNRNRERLLYAL